MNDRVRMRVARGLFALAILMLGIWTWAMLDSHAFQVGLARRLAELGLPGPGRAGGAAVATRREAVETGLVGRIEIPRLGLSAMILEGTSGRALLRGVGHVEQTAFPGEHGNVALAGHRDTYFRRLKKIADGDTIRLHTPDGVFVYRVESMVVVKPERGDLLDPTSKRVLTLVTCYPFSWIGTAPDRFVIRAVQLEAHELPAGHPKTGRAARPADGRSAVRVTARS